MPLYWTTSAILDRWSNIANRQWSNIGYQNPVLTFKDAGHLNATLFSANFVYNVLTGSTAVMWYSGIVISILGDIADDMQHFICVTVLDQR